jgi:hypothetical protein
MATVKIHPADAETPSAKIVAAARTSYDVVAADGRTITLKMPHINAEFDLIEALGDSASNQTFMGMNMPLIFVAAIDGEAIAAPVTRGELRALRTRLDRPGLEAVMNGIAENFGEGGDQDLRKKSAE